MKNKSKLERKLSDEREPNSIFIVPTPKTSEYVLAIMAKRANGLANTIKKRAGFTLSFDIAQEVLEGFEKQTAALWEYARKVVPKLHSFEISKWRFLNDLLDEKVQLAHKRISVSIVPRTEEGGRIAMAANIIVKGNLELCQTGSFDEEKRIEFEQIINDFDDFLRKVADAIGEKYRSPLKEGTEIGDTKDEN